jgi:hypothetical protein
MTGVVVLDILSETPRETSSPYALPSAKVVGSDAELEDGEAEPPQATEQIESEISAKPAIADLRNRVRQAQQENVNRFIGTSHQPLFMISALRN